MKHELIHLLQTLGHTTDLENSLIYSYSNRFADCSIVEFLHEALEDRHLMANRGKMPNRTWEITFTGFLNDGEFAGFDIVCRKPKWPDEAFLYGFEIGIIAKIKKPR